MVTKFGWTLLHAQPCIYPVYRVNIHVCQSRKYAVPAYYRRATQKLPDTPARTRFAPSPTGYMHLGSLRTALFNFLLARATRGQFLLRIEDTDTKRTVPGAEQRILQDLEWTGLAWDEGPNVGGPYGPYRQSERTDIYQRHSEDLLHCGHAYRCFCSAERLDQLARERSKLGLPTDYDRTCAGISKEESDERAHNGHPYTIRLRIPDTYPTYEDLVYGRVGKPNESSKKKSKPRISFEDPILIKSDGLPTYHLANVVDDHYMKITHVIRAVEWMPSTPKHLAMYAAFGWEPPKYAHVGLLQDSERQKLSKRNFDIDIDSFRKRGIFSEALVNHVALMGWSHNEASDFLPLERLIEIFDMKFTKGNTMINFNKLEYLQKRHAHEFILNNEKRSSDIADAVLSALKQNNKADERIYVPPGLTIQSYIVAILKADSKQYLSPSEFYARNRNFFFNAERFERRSLPDAFGNIDHQFTLDALKRISNAEWNEVNLRSVRQELAQKMTSRFSQPIKKQDTVEGTGCSINNKTDEAETQLSRYLRWATMDNQPGPPILTTMELLGRTESINRIEHAIQSSAEDHRLTSTGA